MIPQLGDPEIIAIIARIYDAVIDPDRWPTVIDALRQHFNFINAALTLNILPPNARAVVNVRANVPEQYAWIMEDSEHLKALADAWGGTERLAAVPLEEPILLSETTDPATWMSNAYFRDFAAPQQITDAVAITLTRDHRSIGTLGFGRHASAGAVTSVERDGLRFVAPHLRRAVTVAGILDMSNAASATFQSALEATPSGVFLVDNDMRIVFANGAGEAMLDRGDPVENRHGRLALRHELVPGHLAEAVKTASGGEAALGRRGIGIPTRRADGTALMLHVMPLERRAVRGGTPLRASAAVFVADGTPHSIRADAMAILFDLTPTEGRVFELVAAGHTSHQIAAQLSIAPSTLRTHLLRVFEKTGHHTRADLVRLAASLVLPQ